MSTTSSTRATFKRPGIFRPKITNGETASMGKAIDDHSGNNKKFRLMMDRKPMAIATKAMPAAAGYRSQSCRSCARGPMRPGTICVCVAIISASYLLVYGLAEQSGGTEDQDQDQHAKGQDVAVARSQRREVRQQARKECFQHTQ